MAFSEFERKRYEGLVARFIEKRRSPPHIRAELDLAFRIDGQSVEIFEMRAHWQDKCKTMEHPLPRLRSIKESKIGKCFGKERI